MIIAGTCLDQPGQLKSVQTIQRDLGAQVIKHQEMAGGKLGFARLERTIITRVEARTIEVVVGPGREAASGQIGAPGRPSTLTGVATL